MIDTKCPFCFIEAEADDIQLNKAVRCPGCRKVFIMHAHSTEIPLDPIIPGVPWKKAEKGEAAAGADAAPGAGPGVELDKGEEVFGPTLKIKQIRKTAKFAMRKPSPLLDAEAPSPPLPEPVEASTLRQVEVVRVKVPFRDVLRTVFFVMTSIAIISVVFGLLVFLILAMRRARA